MNKIIFSQSGVYRLQQLATQFYHITGIRRRLADQTTMIDFLRDCSKSDDELIQSYFAAFSSELDEGQASSLRSEGIQPHLFQTH